MREVSNVDLDQVFIVRCWNEAQNLAGTPDVWRLQVRHINCGDVRYFDDPKLVGEFIAARLRQASTQ
ncbi:hypothetical protein NKH48_17575 [Mesorhizobium sp. M1233]|uniref:hypothetical protein n=1 Tax=unclassified Mesorhizobium TaxID=325217 RepID=UPI0033370954